VISTLVIIGIVLVFLLIGLVKLALWSAERFSEHTHTVACRLVAEREQAKEQDAASRDVVERQREQERALAESEAKRAAFQHLKAKAQVWIFRVQEEPWFMDSQERQAFAKAKHQDILTELGPLWCQERRTVMNDESLRYYCEKYEPQVLQWLEARVTLIDLAQRAALGLLDEPPKLSPDEWESKQTAHAQRMAEREYREAEQAISLALTHKIRLQALYQRLVQEHPEQEVTIKQLFEEYEVLKSAPPPPEPKELATTASIAPVPLGPEVL
jgi:hypothetical protein